MAENAELKAIVEAVLRERFDDVTIESMELERDIDQDGDEILRVNVIFDGKKKRLDSRKTSGLLRHLRPKIAEIGEYAFPVVSFISKSDYGKQKTAAA